MRKKLSQNGKWGLIAVVVLGWPLQSLLAERYFIQLQDKERQGTVIVEEKHKKIWVDVLGVADAMGIRRTWKNGVCLIMFPAYTVAIDPQNGGSSVKRRGSRLWEETTPKDKIYKAGDCVFVPLDSLPTVLNARFVYHVQKRVLSTAHEKDDPDGSYRTADVRHVWREGKLWLALEDVAKELGLLVHPTPGNRYNIVMPDIAILEIEVGQSQTYKRREPYKFLEDPPLLFAGSVHLTLNSVNAIFEIDARWDETLRGLVLPERYGRLRELPEFSSRQIRYLGYRAEPFGFELEEVSAYYQRPAPTYFSSHDDPYESVRDFVTNGVIDPKTTGFDRVGGEALANMKGSLFNAPVRARGRFEKLATTSRVLNGTLEWGLPKFQVAGGREYWRFNGLNGQFASVDHVIVSHSGGRRGERASASNYGLRAFYGKHEFDLFVSTADFSQVSEFDQEVTGAGVEWGKSYGSNRLNIRYDQYFFTNDLEKTEGRYFFSDLFDDLFGDDITVDLSDQVALLSTIISERHSTSILETSFNAKDWIQLSGVAGVSSHKDDVPDAKREYDYDTLIRTVWGKPAARLDLSFEKIGPDYRSIGNPLRYQDRRIVRVGPTLQLAKFWRIYGEHRREDVDVLVRQGLKPYTSTYSYFANSLSFRRNYIRLSGSDSSGSLYGRRLRGTIDYSQYFGRDSVDLGYGLTKQWLTGDLLYRRSVTGILGFRILRPSWRVSASEELTRSHYPLRDIWRWESLSTLSFHIRKFRALMSYEVKPRYYTRPEKLHTGFARIGWAVSNRKSISAFYARTSLFQNLKASEVWRAGLAYSYDF